MNIQARIKERIREKEPSPGYAVLYKVRKVFGKSVYIHWARSPMLEAVTILHRQL